MGGNPGRVVECHRSHLRAEPKLKEQETELLLKYNLHMACSKRGVMESVPLLVFGLWGGGENPQATTGKFQERAGIKPATFIPLGDEADSCIGNYHSHHHTVIIPVVPPKSQMHILTMESAQNCI